MDNSKKQENQEHDFERLVDRLLASDAFLDGVTECLKGRLNFSSGTSLGTVIKAFESVADRARSPDKVNSVSEQFSALQQLAQIPHQCSDPLTGRLPEEAKTRDQKPCLGWGKAVVGIAGSPTLECCPRCGRSRQDP